VGTPQTWPFPDPRGAEVPEEEMLDRFKEVRDGIERRILRWLERPEEELARLREELYPQLLDRG
jgi:arsenate reductase (thioredoxin)